MTVYCDITTEHGGEFILEDGVHRAPTLSVKDMATYLCPTSAAALYDALGHLIADRGWSTNADLHAVGWTDAQLAERNPSA